MKISGKAIDRTTKYNTNTITCIAYFLTALFETELLLVHGTVKDFWGLLVSFSRHPLEENRGLLYNCHGVVSFSFEVCYTQMGWKCWVQAAIPTTAVPTTAVPTKSEQWCRDEINIAGQGELEAHRASWAGVRFLGVVVNPYPPTRGSGSTVSSPSGSGVAPVSGEAPAAMSFSAFWVLQWALPHIL